MRILLTGHDGFIGRNLKQKLISTFLTNVGDEICYDDGDLIDDLSISPHVFDHAFDIIIHLAANVVNVDDRMKQGIAAYRDISLDMAMCNYVQNNPPKQAFIVMSSCAVDSPTDPYACVKRTLESMAMTLHRRGLPVVVLRPFSGYGPDQSPEYPFRAILDRAMRREDPLTVWGGSQVRDFIHIDDLTDAIIHAANGGFPFGVPIDIGTGFGTSIKNLARMIANEVGYAPDINCDETKETSSPIRIANPSPAMDRRWRFKIGLDRGIEMAVEAMKAKLV